MTTITVTTANICCNPKRPQKTVAARCRRVARIPGVAFGQEIEIPRYDRAWNQAMKGRGKETHGQQTECPISLPAKAWDVLDAEVIKVHDGLAHVSPARILDVVKAVRVTHERVAFVDCHPVSKPRVNVPSGRWRVARWSDYHSKLVDVVQQLHAAGFTVVFGGDMNKTRVPRVHPAQQVLVQHGLDHLWVVPAPGYQVRVVRRRNVPRTKAMDHPILTASFTLTKGHR